jgi:hypothetical protein
MLVTHAKREYCARSPHAQSAWERQPSGVSPLPQSVRGTTCGADADSRKTKQCPSRRSTVETLVVEHIIERAYPSVSTIQPQSALRNGATVLLDGGVRFLFAVSGYLHAVRFENRCTVTNLE